MGVHIHERCAEADVRARILFGAASFSAAGDGIARLAQLTARVIRDEVAADHLDATCLVLHESEDLDGVGMKTRTVNGSRGRFAYETSRAVFDHTHFVYNHVGVARAHGLARLLGRPFMAWICGIEVWENATSRQIKPAQQADVVVAISNHTLDKARRIHGGFDRAKVCWLGTKTDEPASTRRPGDGPPTVLILGRMDHREGYKGHAELIECWPKVVSAVPDARLVIAGQGAASAEFQRAAVMSPVAEQIRFRGFVPEEQIGALWSDTSVFAMPSRAEGFGLVYVEAMRHGVPVIASIHDAGAEVNANEETGYNVNMDNPDELPERLIDLLKDPQRAFKMGQNGQKRWRKHFCYSAFRSRFLPILSEFLEMR